MDKPTTIKPPKDELLLIAQVNDRAAEVGHKEYGDKHRRAEHTEVKVGDKVLIKQDKMTIRPSTLYAVTEVRNTQVTAKRRGGASRGPGTLRS